MREEKKKNIPNYDRFVLCNQLKVKVIPTGYEFKA